MSRFDPTFDDLPVTLPVFPLPGVLLLPRGVLPLNIFEPRYLNMIEDALACSRMIGMIQPADPEDKSPTPKLYSTGCAGRISSFEETDDGRILIALKGICRFRISEELSAVRGYRRVRPDWKPFESDFDSPPDRTGFDRSKLLPALKGYFHKNEIEANWEALEATPDERLINSLSMICPFGPPEKQALLEAGSVPERGEVLTALVEMAVVGPMCGSDSGCQ